jgi:hypothetical protein
MRLARGVEIIFHAEVELYIPRLEPCTAAFGEFRWFGDLSEAKYIDVKSAGFFLSARRHGNLDVVDGEDFHHGSTGYPAFTQASSPPSRALTLVYPLFKRRNAARALVCSLGQVQ